ncbi:MAG TPA: DUF1592 domain-containing protein [Humisphaera sp.]|jgi:hypothetical protein|nr:DUF1592 domain-containing protein [Humisphaera sp.]
MVRLRFPFSGASIALLAIGFCTTAASAAPAPEPTEQFRKQIQPLLAKYCYDCHGDGEKKGGIAFDELKTDDQLLNNRDLWWRVLKNTRTGLMPPQKKPHPNQEQLVELANWIKYGAFGIDPENPDPGRVTLRRLNRVEYRNTIKDLMGVDYNTTEEFPPDDTGYGFDTIGDVLSFSPLLLEKYMKAAEVIVKGGVPLVARTIPEWNIPGRSFKSTEAGVSAERLSFYKEATVSSSYINTQAADYILKLTVSVRGDFNFDPGRINLVLKVDGKEQWTHEFKWDNGRKFQFDIPQTWDTGNHALALEVHPLTPPEQRRTNIDMQIQSLVIAGPTDPKFWNVSKNYARFFPRPEPPKDPAERREYAREVLTAFTKKAFRRPTDAVTVAKLVKIAEAGWSAPGKQFEQGIGEAMIATLSSPRFLFRVEQTIKSKPDEMYSKIDEYSLANRLSYFLWSTMPDDELMDLANRGELRKNYAAQVKRLMSDERAVAMVHNFTGQWLQLRDVDSIAIDARVVLARDTNTEKELQAQLAQRGRGFGQFNQNQQGRGRNGQPIAANGAAQPNANGANPTAPNGANGAAPAAATGAMPATAGTGTTPAPAGTGTTPARAIANAAPGTGAPSTGAPATGTPVAGTPATATPATGAPATGTPPTVVANTTGGGPEAPAVANGAAAGAGATPPAANGANPAAAVANANGQPAAAGARGAFANGRGQRGFGGRGRFGQPAVQLDGPLRTAMRSEPEMLFETIVREDRSLLELLDCNYTFVNASLGKLYGIQNVVGTDMQRVDLAKDSPRGGLLTMGSLLVVTSNPTRTSPVKRGQFILDNILGMPAPPPPPDIPVLEDAAKGLDHDPTFREVLELHRDKPLCKSCHARMDPLGLSLENFNALGMFRDKERGQTIDASGQLLTGEKFKDVRELKQILVTNHQDDFYRCLTEKMLTYALGRGLEYYDVETVDRIVDRLKKENGRYSVLLTGIVESAPFQEKRNFVAPPERKPEQRAQLDVHP